MASRFETLSGSAGVSALFLQLGTPAACTYHPYGASDVELTAVLGPVHAGEDALTEGRRKYLYRDIIITTDSSGPHGGVNTPGLKDTFTDDAGDKWAVASINSMAGGLASLRVTRSAMIEASRSDYRREQRDATRRDPRRGKFG